MSEILDIVKLYQQIGWPMTIAITVFLGMNKYQFYRLRSELVRRDEKIMTVLSADGVDKKTHRVPLAKWQQLGLFDADAVAE